MVRQQIDLNLLTLYPPQRKFYDAYYNSSTKRILYGGARGGGKSAALRDICSDLAVSEAGIQILIVRRTYPELRANHIIHLSKILWPLIKAKLVSYNDSNKEFVFWNESRITLGYCDSDKAVLRYQGQSYDLICLDEATQLSELQYTAFTECCRPSGLYKGKLPPKMLLTANPGGIGHAWVKRLFIDRIYQQSEKPEDYAFIPSRVYDNKFIMENDPDYVRALENIADPQRRKAYLDGDWDIFMGQYFTQFKRELHVIKPFVYPPHWKQYIALDYGLDMLAAYQIAVDVSGRAFVVKEIYQPELIVSAAAEKIRELFDVNHAEAVFAPGDLWNRNRDTGKSTSDIFAEHGVVLTQVSNDRIQGWYNLHEWLNPTDNESGDKEPMLKIFENCENLIRTLPALQYSEKNPNDTATEPHEITHAPDALRYFVSGRPLKASTPILKDYDEVTYEDNMISFLNF